MSTAVFPFDVWPEGILQARIPANDNSLRNEVLSKAAKTIANAAPGSPTEGDVHIVGTAWGGFATGDVVIRKSATWLGYAPFTGWLKFNETDSKVYKYQGSWSEFAGGTGGGSAVTALTISSGVVNIDCSLGDYFTLALNANVTSITFSNLPGAGKGASKMIRITQDSTPRTVAWPASFRWDGNGAQSVSTGSGAVDVLAITTLDNGTKWDATLSKGRA